jgi:hypothetical protein
MLARALVPVVALAAWSGCGTSDEESVQQVVRDYHRAAVEGDADRACSLTADEYWADIRGTCEEFIELRAEIPDDDGAGERLANGDYDVTVDGETATAQATNLGIFMLRKLDGVWMLTSVR